MEVNLNKIFVTHVGSLPRTQEVVDYIFARENNQKYNQNQFDSVMSNAVLETVKKQVDAGVDIVSDGETSKISYATYVKDRYNGFSGDSPRNPPADLKMFPSFLKRLAEDGGTPKYSRPMCTDRITSKGQVDLKKDINNLKMMLDVNGERMQTGNTSTMIFNVDIIVSYVSKFMSLQPGDIITTGTPPGVGMGRKPQVFLKAGDQMKLSIENLGEQNSKVVAV